jgi:hypothetical protein
MDLELNNQVKLKSKHQFMSQLFPLRFLKFRHLHSGSIGIVIQIKKLHYKN